MSRVARYRKTKKGLLRNVYSDQVRHCKITRAKYERKVHYTSDEFYNNYINNPVFGKLFDNWVNSGHKTELKPSFDRIDVKKDYSFDNLQIITWQENKTKGHSECGILRTTPVFQTDSQGNILRRYNSIKEACEDTGCTPSCVVGVCRGKKENTKGFYFKYTGERFSQRRNII